MAKAVAFKQFTPPDSRDDLARDLERAPIENAEAVLAGYDLLRRLHDKGVLELLSGLLSAGDTVVERLTDVVSSPQAVTALRIALTFGDLLSSIDPGKLHAVLSSAEKGDPPSLLSIVRQANSRDARRGMAAAVGLLNVFGATLNARSAAEEKKHS